jgi:hypothetical protein
LILSDGSGGILDGFGELSIDPGRFNDLLRAIDCDLCIPIRGDAIGDPVPNASLVCERLEAL